MSNIVSRFLSFVSSGVIKICQYFKKIVCGILRFIQVHLCGDERDREIKLLKDQIARLISKNLEIKHQLEELRREKAEIPMESLAVLTVRSAHAAEDAIAQESPDGKGYVVSHLETMLRGFFVQRGEQLALRLPYPERAAPSEDLSALKMTFAKIPPPANTPATRAPSPAENLVGALERAQASLGARQVGYDAHEPLQVLVHVTRLLDMYPRWVGDEFTDELQRLAEAAMEFETAQVPTASLENYGAAARQLRDHVRSVAQSRLVTPKDMETLGLLVDHIAQSYKAVTPND
jgi:hypothetical protein